MISQPLDLHSNPLQILPLHEVVHIAHCTVLPIITRLNSIIKMFRSFLASHPSPTIRAVILSILKLISPSSSCFTDTVHIIMSVKGFLYNVILQRNTTNMIFDQSVQCSLSTVKNSVYKCSWMCSYGYYALCDASYQPSFNIIFINKHMYSIFRII